MTKLIKSLGQIYELSFLSRKDLNRIFSLKLPLWVFFFLILVITGGLLGCGYWLTANTPLKYTIEGYPTQDELFLKKKLTKQIIALEKKIAYQDSLLHYLALPGSVPNETITPYQRNKTYASQLNLPFQAKNQSNISTPSYFSATVPTNEDILQIAPPIKGLVSRGLYLEEQHYGIDIAVPAGQMVFAAHDGIVVLSEYSIQTGWIIVIMSSSGVVTVYKHNQETLVKVGDKVQKGTPIAIAGNLGQLSTGSHLHFEIWDRGKLIDPLKWLSLPRL